MDVFIEIKLTRSYSLCISTKCIRERKEREKMFINMKSQAKHIQWSYSHFVSDNFIFFLQEKLLTHTCNSM